MPMISGVAKPQVIVVGAGAIGLSIALRLAERGARVQVFDSGARIMSPPERSASARAAGLLGPYSESLHEPVGAHPGLLALGVESLALWPRFAERLARSALEPVYAPSGSIVAAGAGAHTGAVMRLLQRAREAGEPAQLLSRRELGMAFPALAGRSVLAARFESEAQVRPGAALVALQRALRRETGAAVRGVEAQGLAIEAGRCVGVRLRARAPGDEREARADLVVLAPGAWAPPELIADAPALSRVTPAKGHLIELAAPPGMAPTPLRAERFYLAPRNERLVRVGSTMEPGRSDHVVDPQAVEGLRLAVAEFLPEFASAPVLSQWAGVRAMSPDWGPLIGEAGVPGCLIACGHSRNGWLLAPVTAEIVSAQVFGAPLPSLWASFAPARRGNGASVKGGSTKADHAETA